MSHKKLTLKLFFIVNWKTCIIWGFEQLYSSIAWWVM